MKKRFKEKNPSVSIVIPTYNGERFLDEALESAVSQTWNDLEVLVCDDCSKDNTVGIVLEHKRRDSRVRLIKNDRNLGLVGNWNRCVREASGEWIKFLFQDDLLKKNCLKKMMLHSGKCDFVLCERNFIIEPEADPGLKEFYTHGVERFGDTIRLTGMVEAEAIAHVLKAQKVGVNFFGEPTSMLINKRLFMRYGDFRPQYIHICDLELCARFASNEGLFYIDEPLVGFRVHNRSASVENHRSRLFDVQVMDPLNLLWAFETEGVYECLRKVDGARTEISRQRNALIRTAEEIHGHMVDEHTLTRFKSLSALSEKKRLPVTVLISLSRYDRQAIESWVENIAEHDTVPEEIIFTINENRKENNVLVNRLVDRYGDGWARVCSVPGSMVNEPVSQTPMHDARGQFVMLLGSHLPDRLPLFEMAVTVMKKHDRFTVCSVEGDEREPELLPWFTALLRDWTIGRLGEKLGSEYVLIRKTKQLGSGKKKSKPFTCHKVRPGYGGSGHSVCRIRQLSRRTNIDNAHLIENVDPCGESQKKIIGIRSIFIGHQKISHGTQSVTMTFLRPSVLFFLFLPAMIMRCLRLWRIFQRKGKN